MLKLRPRARPVLPALIAFAFLFGAASALAQQDAPMPREARILVQKGLTALGFDAGPADGLFGPKTRTAIRDWQAAKGLEATGYLTHAQAEALGAVAREAQANYEKPGGATAGTQARKESEPSSGRLEPQMIRSPRCGEIKSDGCWRELSSPAKCDMWLARYRPSGVFAPGKTVIWSGDCRDSLAYGRDTLKVGGWNATGELVEGKWFGRWVIRTADGTVTEIHFVSSKRHGRLVIRRADGTTEAQEYRNGHLVP